MRRAALLMFLATAVTGSAATGEASSACNQDEGFGEFRLALHGSHSA